MEISLVGDVTGGISTVGDVTDGDFFSRRCDCQCFLQ